MIHKILVITSKTSGSYNGGVALTSDVIEFDFKEDAEKSIDNIKSMNDHTTNYNVNVIRLY